MTVQKLVETYEDVAVDDGTGQIGPTLAPGSFADTILWVTNTGANDVTLTPWGWPPGTASDASLFAGSEWDGGPIAVGVGARVSYCYSGNVPAYIGFQTECAGGSTVTIQVIGRTP